MKDKKLPDIILVLSPPLPFPQGKIIVLMK
jgi:hypothetical protein